MRLLAKNLHVIRGCSKNPHRHSERSEESQVFLFKSKNQKRDPLDLRPRDGKKVNL